MTQVNYSTLLNGLTRDASGVVRGHIPDNWLQGRTTYGGLSAALCLEAALPHSRDMSLRSAQVAFVGPAGGDITLRAETLREGKSSTYVSVDLIGEKGIATRAIFVFGLARADHPVDMPTHLAAPENITPPGTKGRMIPEAVGPAFLVNFEIELVSGAVPMTGATEVDNLYWLAHRDPDAKTDLTALLALTDAPPPAALSLSKGPARISSMNWSIDILCEHVDPDAKWFLSRSTAQTARNGYSAQSMRLWDQHGTPIMASRQTIAMF